VPYVLLSLNTFSVGVFVVVLGTAMYLTAKGRNLNWVVRRLKSVARSGRIQSRPLGYRRRLNGMVHVNFFDFDSWRNK
jgi:hypothetical protein